MNLLVNKKQNKITANKLRVSNEEERQNQCLRQGPLGKENAKKCFQRLCYESLDGRLVMRENPGQKNYETPIPIIKKNNNNWASTHKDTRHTHCWVNSNTLHHWWGEKNNGDTVLPRMCKQRWLEQHKRCLEKKTAIQTLAALFGNQPSSSLILTCLHNFHQL